jgi:hypothetical protein
MFLTRTKKVKKCPEMPVSTCRVSAAVINSRV